jgi:Kef-type K+ transport system membrane component KefB
MTDHQLLLFLLEVVVLFLAARIGGEVAARIGIPLHVGELLVGVLLGPSLLGWVLPEAFGSLFPLRPEQRSLLELFSWIGIIFLIILGGLETRLGVLKSVPGAVLGGWIGGFGLPFAMGFGLGSIFPDALVPAGVDKPVFALFLATAMSISAIPVIARILMDLDLYRTRVGMVILSTAIMDDTIGWAVLAVVVGLASGGVDTTHVAWMLTLTAVFLAAAFTIGRKLVRGSMRFARSLKAPYAELSMMMFLVFGAGAVTQAIGVHLVLGCFVASILLGRIPPRPETQEAIRHVGMGFFVPFFFAYTGIKVDLTTLGSSALLFAIVAVAVACLGKIVGGGLGARLGGLPRWEALAVGFGLNARGAMELVIAAVGLAAGIVTEATYAIVVLIAVITTIIAGPSMRWSMKHAEMDARSEPDPTVSMKKGAMIG